MQPKKEKILFVHGGPGMDCAYIKPYFSDLENEYELIYPDQHGCGERIEQTNLDDTVNDFINILKDHQPEYIIAHSWGAYLLLFVCRKWALSFLKKVVLISPMDLDKELSDRMSKNILTKFSAEDLITYNKFLDEKMFGSELLKLVVPYQMGFKPTQLVNYGNMKYDVWRSINDDLKGTSVSGDVPRLPDFQIIAGETEQIDSRWEDYSNLKDLQYIKKAGHYSFAEQNERTIFVIKRFLEK